ncbi:globin family protein [Piscinibacter gummiphilus]|uniref:Globin family protein n=1 Tax=Piscinibacter gummiphilus TaxID=946333 RepID=A0ABZ0CXL9_9BURK|nr:globin family protein [Piscinibacter gummiphilus]WOB09261.1 globin family protein [Piscinibacter gummiphilus]
MTPTQIAHIRRSFTLIEPIAQQAAALFYDNLFTADPQLRRLFQGNMAQQGARLMNMIATAVDLLEAPDALIPALRKLGSRHVNYGVKDEHYATVGAALLKTLRQGLGEAYTDDVHAAWVALYGVVSTTMMEASRTATEAQAA